MCLVGELNTQPSAPSSFYGAAYVLGSAAGCVSLTVCAAHPTTHGHGWRQQEQRGVAPWGTPSSKHTDLQAPDVSSCTFSVWLDSSQPSDPECVIVALRCDRSGMGSVLVVGCCRLLQHVHVALALWRGVCCKPVSAAWHADFSGQGWWAARVHRGVQRMPDAAEASVAGAQPSPSNPMDCQHVGGVCLLFGSWRHTVRSV